MWPDICQPPQLIAHVCFAHLGPAILPFSSLLWRHQTCYCPRRHLFFTSGSAPRSLHGLLLHVIQGSQVLKVTSYTDHPIQSGHAPALLLLHLVLFPLSYITVWNASSIYVFTAYLLPLKYKFHEDRTLLCHVCCYIPNSRTEPGWQTYAGSGNESTTPVCQEVGGREMVKMGIV